MDLRLAALYVRRFSPQHRIAFDAWLRTNPQSNPHAPAGPSFVPGYRNPTADQARRLDSQADAVFQKGASAREDGDRYIRATVFLASILFVIVIAQRLQVKGVRHALVGVAFLLLVIAGITIFT